MAWNVRKFIATALDPVHVGTGGERLGRVDLTVVREPVTNIPKLPGTSLSGAVKFFTDLALRDIGVKAEVCASTRGSDKKNKHDRERCPVCSAFGFTAEEDENESSVASRQGILQFTDAHILAFPVTTFSGPAWLTTKPRLHDIMGVGDGLDDLGDSFAIPAGSALKPLPGDRLNFGWVILQKTPAPVGAVDELKAKGLPSAPRLAIVSEWLFSNLVNDGMEVRTSVVINPETGAAKTGGLFTYEAVPRGTLFFSEIVQNDFSQLWRNVRWPEEKAPKPDSPCSMLETYGFPGVKAVGLGGMTSRGFGRLEFRQLP